MPLHFLPYKQNQCTQPLQAKSMFSSKFVKKLQFRKKEFYRKAAQKISSFKSSFRTLNVVNNSTILSGQQFNTPKKSVKKLRKLRQFEKSELHYEEDFNMQKRSRGHLMGHCINRCQAKIFKLQVWITYSQLSLMTM